MTINIKMGLLATLLPLALNAQLQIGPGTNFRSNAATYIVLNNTGFMYNTNTQVLDNFFKFTGNTDAFISGTNLPIFSTIQIAKTGTGKLILQRNINIFQSVAFQSGLFDLTDHYVNLGTNALVNGENETAKFTGNLGEVIIIPTLNAPNGVNPGNLGAIFTSSANLGTVIIRRGHKSQTSNGAGSSILRYYNIEPANNTGLNATLRFSFLEAELNGLLESSLTMWKSSNNTNWQNAGFTSRNTIANWVELTGINNFSRWTLSSPGNALPLSWNSFAALCNNNKVTVSWKTLQEANTLSFAVQRSTNGINWNTIGNLPAAGNSNSTLNYSYNDQLPLPATAYYRILQTDIDGKFTYSPVLKSNCSTVESIKIFPTVTNDIVNITTPQNPLVQKMVVQFFDAAGKILLRKELATGTQQLSVGHLPAGMYMLEIQYGSAVSITKIVRQ